MDEKSAREFIEKWEMEVERLCWTASEHLAYDREIIMKAIHHREAIEMVIVDFKKRMGINE